MRSISTPDSKLFRTWLRFGLMETPTLINDILQQIADLTVEDQVLITEILNRRMVELKRNQLLARVKEAEANYQAGRVQAGSVADLMQLTDDD